MEDVARETFLDAEPAEVWEALADADRLGDWFGVDVSGEIAEGEVVRFGDDRAVIERAEPGRRLTFRYVPRDHEETSRVDITLDEVPDGTILRVVERRIESAVSSTPRIGFKALARL